MHRQSVSFTTIALFAILLLLAVIAGATVDFAPVPDTIVGGPTPSVDLLHIGTTGTGIVHDTTTLSLIAALIGAWVVLFAYLNVRLLRGWRRRRRNRRDAASSGQWIGGVSTDRRRRPRSNRLTVLAAALRRRIPHRRAPNPVLRTARKKTARRWPWLRRHQAVLLPGAPTTSGRVDSRRGPRIHRPTFHGPRVRLPSFSRPAFRGPALHLSFARFRRTSRPLIVPVPREEPINGTVIAITPLPMAQTRSRVSLRQMVGRLRLHRPAIQGTRARCPILHRPQITAYRIALLSIPAAILAIAILSVGLLPLLQTALAFEHRPRAEPDAEPRLDAEPDAEPHPEPVDRAHVEPHADAESRSDAESGDHSEPDPGRCLRRAEERPATMSRRG